MRVYHRCATEGPSRRASPVACVPRLPDAQRFCAGPVPEARLTGVISSNVYP
jgi:hypothetical protein